MGRSLDRDDLPVRTKSALLQELTRGRGYKQDLIARIFRYTGYTVSLYSAGVYEALRAMEDDGLVKRCNGDRGFGPNAKIWFEITEKGREAADRDRDFIAELFKEVPKAKKQRRDVPRVGDIIGRPATIEDAAETVLRELAHGPMLARDLRARVTSLGYSRHQYHQAAKNARVVFNRQGRNILARLPSPLP